MGSESWGKCEEPAPFAVWDLEPGLFNNGKNSEELGTFQKMLSTLLENDSPAS